jgi:hypothetical protein
MTGNNTTMKEIVATAVNPNPALTGSACIVTGASG